MPEFTCLVGTMVQETYATAPAIRAACERSITGHAATLEADIDAAMCERNMAPEWTATSLALHTQGVFILAKATGGAEIAADSIGPRWRKSNPRSVWRELRSAAWPAHLRSLVALLAEGAEQSYV